MTLSNNEMGVVSGGALGLYKGIELIIINFASISLELVIQACIISFLGGILGWCGSELMNQIKRYFKKKRNDKKD